MRYILDDNGYIYSVSCNPIECNNKGCTGYTGATPEGYDSIEIWATTANIRAYKIVDGNLVYDEAKASELEAEWEQCKYKTNILTARLASNYTLAADSVYETLPLTKWRQLGDKLIMNSDGTVTIGEGVSYIKLSGSCRFRSGAISNKYMTILNGTNQIMQVCTYRASTTGFTSLSGTAGVLPVKAGDIIKYQVYGSKGDSIGGSNSSVGQLATYMTIEVIE